MWWERMCIVQFVHEQFLENGIWVRERTFVQNICLCLRQHTIPYAYVCMCTCDGDDSFPFESVRPFLSPSLFFCFFVFFVLFKNYFRSDLNCVWHQTMNFNYRNEISCEFKQQKKRFEENQCWIHLFVYFSSFLSRNNVTQHCFLVTWVIVLYCECFYDLRIKNKWPYRILKHWKKFAILLPWFNWAQNVKFFLH